MQILTIDFPHSVEITIPAMADHIVPDPWEVLDITPELVHDVVLDRLRDLIVDHMRDAGFTQNEINEMSVRPFVPPPPRPIIAELGTAPF